MGSCGSDEFGTSEIHLWCLWFQRCFQFRLAKPVVNPSSVICACVLVHLWENILFVSNLFNRMMVNVRGIDINVFVSMVGTSNVELKFQTFFF